MPRVIRATYPEAKRTYLRFADAAYSGANLYALLAPASRQAVAFWRRVERERKRPWRLVRAFGLRPLLSYLLGRLTLDDAMAAGQQSHRRPGRGGAAAVRRGGDRRRQAGRPRAGRDDPEPERRLNVMAATERGFRLAHLSDLHIGPLPRVTARHAAEQACSRLFVLARAQAARSSAGGASGAAPGPPGERARSHRGYRRPDQPCPTG